MSRLLSYRQKLLEQLAKTPIIQVACERAGVPRSTYYRWRKSDQKFAAVCDQAIEASTNLVNDMAEAQLIASIKDRNLSAIVYWLKHHHHAYRNRLEIDAKVKAEQQELTAEQAQTVGQALRLAGLIESSEEEADGSG